jgi:putative MATE family efflux protein
MADNNSFQLTTQPIPHLVRKIAVPASVGYFFHTMYNVVDTYFAGLISTQALASLSLSLPVFFIIIAMGTGIATGATALIGNALGAGDREGARLLAVQGISFGVLTAVFLTALSVYLSPFLFGVLGASGGYLVMAVTYMNTIFLGTVFFMLVYMLNAILNAVGETRPFRNFLIAGFFMNIVLDPWFIYGGLGLPALGLVGIALATVLIQLVGCVYLGFRVYRTGLVSGKAASEIFPKPGPFKEIARQGFPASFNMLTVGLGIFVITYFVSFFGKEAVAAYGIAMRVEQIVLIPTIGLNIATLTLVAQNNGAGLFHRVQEAMGTALRYGGIIMTFGTIGVFALARPWMSFFTDDGKVIEMGATYLRIDALVLYAYVLLFVHVAAMQGIKRPMFALWIGFYRQLVAPGVVFYVLTCSLDFGLLGIWWGIFAITWSAAVFTLFYVRRALGRVMQAVPGKKPTPEEPAPV